MNTQLLLILCLIGWISVGPVLSVVMGRRGHSPAAWGTIGMFLGPLALPLAADAVWRRRRPPVTILVDAPVGPGPVAMLAGIDGSEEANAALAHAVGVVGDRIRPPTSPCWSRTRRSPAGGWTRRSGSHPT